MKIIDAHMHFSKAIPSFAPMAERVGHLYTEEHLQAEFARLNIERAVVMGNSSIRPECHQYPDFLRYCIGLDNKVMEALPDAHILDLLEQNPTTRKLCRHQAVSRLQPRICRRCALFPVV